MLHLRDLAYTLSQHGWLRSPDNKLKQPIDVVEFDDGRVVTLDHRRVVAACQENVARVFCKAHHLLAQYWQASKGLGPELCVNVVYCRYAFIV